MATPSTSARRASRAPRSASTTARTGFAYQLGRDKDRARSAALLDALWQGAERDAVEAALVPIRTRIAADAALQARRVAATRVDFFTMVRGED